MNYDWLIIGGGIHGVHVATRLLGEARIKSERLRIIDPGPKLLSRWRTFTARTGMTFLRSPAVHHLDLNPVSLQRFAGGSRGQKSGRFAPPYNRPSLALFNSHCDHVVDTYALEGLHIADKVVACDVIVDGGVEVTLSSGSTLTTKNLVLAIGASEQPERPKWAPIDESRIHHIFDDDASWPTHPERILVVGGGITAGQVAMRLMGEGHHVEMASRHELRKHRFDSDSGWLGPKLMAGFSRRRNLDRRRADILRARHRGSVPQNLHRQLKRAISTGALGWHQAEVAAIDIRSSDIEARLSDGKVVTSDRIVLATGFSHHRPGGKMIDDLIMSASLPCAKCGYPVVDTSLQWHSGIFVTGPLAELELGPVARNIAGARRAGDRIVSSV